MTHKKRIDPVGIDREELRRLIAVSQLVFVNIGISDHNTSYCYSELFTTIFDQFYATTGCTFDEFMDEMRELFKGIINQEEMEKLWL